MYEAHPSWLSGGHWHAISGWSVIEEASLEEIAKLLEKHRIKRVPFVRNGKLVGIVSRANLLQEIVARKRAPRPSVDDRRLRGLVTAATRACGVCSDFVNPVVVDGIVDLWVMALSEAERDAIYEVAAGVSGVKGVEHQFGVLSPMLAANMWVQ